MKKPAQRQVCSGVDARQMFTVGVDLVAQDLMSGHHVRSPGILAKQSDNRKTQWLRLPLIPSNLWNV